MHKSPLSIRHLSLDLWLTLIRSNKAFKPARTKLFKESFKLSQSLEEILYVFAEQDRVFNIINEKTGRNLSREEMLYLVLAKLGENVGDISLEKLNTFFEKADVLFEKHPPELLESSICDALAEIKKAGITISILSNTAFILGTSLRKFLEEKGLGGIFDFQIYSDECGHSKPAPEAFNLVFKHASQKNPVTRTQILHIGDNSRADYQGALKVGMQAALFQPNVLPLSRLLMQTLCIPITPSIT